MRALALIVAAGTMAATGCGGGSSDAPPPGAPPVWSEAVTLPAPAPPPSADAVVRPDGTAIAVWAERTDGAASRLLAAERDGAGAWGAGAPITAESPTPIQSARVAVDSAGVATAVWALWDRPAGAVFAFVQTSRQQPDGTWSEPQTLSRGTNGLTEVLAAAHDDGRVVVVWSGSERRNGSYFAEVRSATRSPQGRWGFARVAGIGRGDPFLARDGLAAAPGSGRTRLIWSSFQRRGFPGGVLTSVLGDNGRWAIPRRVSGPGESFPSDLTVATGSDGTMTAVWGRRGDGALRLTRSRGGGWSAPRTLPGGRAGSTPRVAAGPDGAALIVLERSRPRQGRSLLQAVRVRRNGAITAPRTIASRAVPPPVGSADRFPIPWAATAALEAGGTATVAWPRSRQRPDGIVLSTAIVARRTASPGAWGKRETVADLAIPAVGVSPDLDVLPDAGLQVRWNTAATGSETLLSTRNP